MTATMLVDNPVQLNLCRHSSFVISHMITLDHLCTVINMALVEESLSTRTDAVSSCCQLPRPFSSK
jgi:hypothetical protein